MHLTDHAVRRMQVRGVSVLEVELVLAAPAHVVTHAHGTASHFGWDLDGHKIVVVTQADDYDRVVTVMHEEAR